jgi:hypothetical protein
MDAGRGGGPPPNDLPGVGDRAQVVAERAAADGGRPAGRRPAVWGLLERRERWALTWRGRLVVGGSLLAVAVAITRNLCGFLAVSQPVAGQFLVVEGWMPQYAYQRAAELFHGGRYRLVVAVGSLQDAGDGSGDLREFAPVGRLVAAGIPANRIASATGSAVHQDRTFHSALNVRGWLRAQGVHTASLDVVTLGPHARRSRLLYEKALGGAFEVGVISVADARYEPAHWWRSSEGVRDVISEAVAYLYARFIFQP